MSFRALPDPFELGSLTELLAGADGAGCCASLYGHPAVRWVLGDELHPGGESTTRRALELLGAGAADQLLDVACGRGASALLAARELGCQVTAIDSDEAAIEEGARAAFAAALGDRITFLRGDADTLPFADGSFDAVLCECSLCLFADKGAALAEIRRVLRPDGRLAIADVIADRERLPASLDDVIAITACIGTALADRELCRLLADSGFELRVTESCSRAAAAMADRVHDRLRGARLALAGQAPALAATLRQAVAVAGEARLAIEQGALDYAIFAATARPAPFAERM